MRLIVGILLFSLAVAATGHAAPTSAESATQLAIAEYKQENYEEALKLLMLIRTANWTTPTSDYYTGLCQKETGDYEEAATSLASALKGKPPVKDAAVELVSVLDNLDRPDEALKWVAWAEQERVKPHEIAFLKGKLLANKQRYSDALVAFNAAKTGSAEEDQQVDLQIAVVYAQQGKTKEASQSLKAIITRYPGTDVAQFATEYQQRISEAASAKRWNLFAGVNYQYDDNAIAVPKLRSVRTDMRDENDSAFSESLRFEYDAPLGGRWAGNLQYSVQNSNYTRLHDVNALAHGLTLTAIHRDDILMTSLPLNISQTAIDYKNYSLQAGAKPTATVIFAPEHLGQASLGYTRREMYQNGQGPDNRDANIYNGQLSYIFLFNEGQGMLNLRGEMFYEDTKGTEWRNLGSRVGTDALVPLCKKTKLILSMEGSWQDYRESVKNRKDTTFIGSATINQHVVSNLYLNLLYSYTRAMSNDDLYDYQRNVVSTGFELRF